MRMRALLIVFLALLTHAHAQQTVPSHLDQLMQSRFAAGDFNGTVLVAREGKILSSAPSASPIANGTFPTTCKPNLKSAP
jgi:hypothetical protein